MPRKKEHTRPDGRIERKIKTGRIKPDGTPERVSVYGFSLDEIEEKKKKLYLLSEYVAVDDTVLLKDWADKWLAAYKSSGIKDITKHNTYKSIVENHIKPYFKDARLSAIRPIDIQNFYNEKSGCSASILNKIKLNLNAMFDAAIDNDLLVKNPAKKIRYTSTKQKNVKRAYTKKEVDHIISYAKTHSLGAPIIVILKTGLRRAELLALEWSDINFKDKTIKVKGSVTETNGVIRIGTPKTVQSMEPIAFDDELKTVLLSIPHHVKSSLVFPNKKGMPYSPSNWSRRNYKNFMDDYKAYCDKNKIPVRILAPHELRHTFGTLVYEATHDIYITAKMLRNSVEICAKTYVHENMDTKHKALGKVSKLK